MHKHLTARVVAALAIFTIALLGVLRASAVSQQSWISSPISVNKQADTSSLPQTASTAGNVDCLSTAGYECIVSANYGYATNGSKVGFGSADKFTPVITYVDGRQHFYPVPNSDTAISVYNGGAVYGLNLAFNRSFTASSRLEGNIITGYTYRMINAPDAVLADKTNHLLPADTLSMGFSQNGRWTVLSSPNLAMLRVDLQTFDVLPFAPGFNYTIGLAPDVKTAISNDGRYAVAFSKNSNTFKIYDLSTCSTVPDKITGPAACQSRDLYPFIQQSIAGYITTYSVRFMEDGNLAIYASYKSPDSSNKIARYIISDDGTSHQSDYLALGDSYISGEGAFAYLPGTDIDTNKCHLSRLAYPYLLGRDLGYNSYHSVACSGALTHDITDTSLAYPGQADFGQISRFQKDLNGDTDSILSSFSPGYIDQLDFVNAYQPGIITVSVGGNDMGFANILAGCVEFWQPNTCYSTYEDRLELVHLINTTVFNNLVKTYSELKSAGPPDMRVYAIGYPQIVKPGGSCGLNVRMNSDELVFGQELISYLDQIVRQAAAKTGVYYVDAEDALYGFRLCEASPGTSAINGLTAGNDKPASLNGPIANESYHPTPAGYQLLENKILSASLNLTAPMPPANPSAAPPAEAGLPLLDVSHSGRTVKTIEYDPGIVPDLAYRQVPVNISISGSTHALPPGTALSAELHSDVINLGNYTTDASGDLSAQITIPASAPTGYHTVHFYGTDISGQPIDIYKYIYVAKSADDLDGNGVADSRQSCVGIPASGQDFDKDGIDDACDAVITQPPADPPAVGQSAAAQESKDISSGGTAINPTEVLAVQTADSPLDSPADAIPALASADSKHTNGKVLGAVTTVPAESTLPTGKSGNYFNLVKLASGILILLSGVFGFMLKLRPKTNR